MPQEVAGAEGHYGYDGCWELKPITLVGVVKSVRALPRGPPLFHLFTHSWVHLCAGETSLGVRALQKI